jgi:hypothetical protein
MSEFETDIDDVRERLDDLASELSRHERVLDSVAEEPEGYDADSVETYLSDLDEALRDAEFLEAARDSFDSLEEAVDEAEAEFLESARVTVDGREIEDTELQSLDPVDSPESAEMLVPSPKINQMRSGAQLELEDGSTFRITIQKTLIEEVDDDKSGYLKLVLDLEPLD